MKSAAAILLLFNLNSMPFTIGRGIKKYAKFSSCSTLLKLMNILSNLIIKYFLYLYFILQAI